MSDILQTDLATRARYAQGGGIYRIIPAAVGRPHDRAALHAMLAAARTAGLAITIRGAGSAMGGGNVGEGLVIDLSAFEAGRCQLDAGRRRATASPGLPLAQLQAAARPWGLHCPLDPSSARWATLGGLVGTNAAGARTVRDGPMRRWVEALVLDNGEGPLTLARGVAPDAAHPVVRRFHAGAAPLLAAHRAAVLARWPATRKNTLGYALDAWYTSGDLLDLVIGAEGTLGVITDVTVRLAPLVEHQGTLRITLTDRAAVETAVAVLQPLDPVRLEFLDRTFLQVVDPAEQAGAVLLVDLEDDDPDRLSTRLAAAAAAMRALGPAVVVVEQGADAAACHALWSVRHGASPRLAALTDGRRSLQVIEDGCVPPGRLGAYLEAVANAGARHGVDLVMFGHAGDRHVHVNLLPDVTRPEWLDRVRAIYAEVSDALMALGGTPAGEHGAGRLRAGLVAHFLGSDAVACMRAVHAAFDPDGRWNPGVILPDRADPFERLKVGADAAPLPPGVSEALQRVEAEARWGDPRTALVSQG